MAEKEKQDKQHKREGEQGDTKGYTYIPHNAINLSGPGCLKYPEDFLNLNFLRREEDKKKD